MRTIVFASDHAGYELKESLKSLFADPEFNAGSHDGIPKQIGDMQYSLLDLGTDNTDSVDYPDYGKAAAEVVASGSAALGVVICGSGIGISIAANRNPKIRCALCTNVETAKLARQHNDANMLALGARMLLTDDAAEIVKAFLATEFEGGRHSKRVEKLSS